MPSNRAGVERERGGLSDQKELGFFQKGGLLLGDRAGKRKETQSQLRKEYLTTLSIAEKTWGFIKSV